MVMLDEILSRGCHPAEFPYLLGMNAPARAELASAWGRLYRSPSAWAGQRRWRARFVLLEQVFEAGVGLLAVPNREHAHSP